MAAQQTLTEDEMSLLITLRAISDFNKDNPDNIPEEGIGNIIVTNGLLDSKKLDELSDSLIEKGLINVEYLLTTNGEKFIAELEEELKQTAGDTNLPENPNYSKEFLKKVSEKLKSMAEKINANTAIGGANLILNIIIAIENFVFH